MFENIFNDSVFCKLGAGMCRLTMDGKIAVKTSKGYMSWDPDKERITNQSNFAIDIGNDFFFVVPTNKVKKGDIILVHGKPRCVTEPGKNRIKVVNYETQEEDTILPERHIFMGSTYFYGKIVSMAQGFFNKKGGTNNMMKMAMMSQMMNSMNGGDNSNNNGGLFGGNMMNLFMMQAMMGGKDDAGIFGMFDGIFDDDDDDVDVMEILTGDNKKDEEDE